jgi:hypothetical protein
MATKKKPSGPKNTPLSTKMQNKQYDGKSSSNSGMKNGTPTTAKLNSLLDKGMSKKEIVQKYGGKDNLSAHDLDVLGFGNKAIVASKGHLPKNPYQGSSSGGGNSVSNPQPGRGSVADTYPSIEEYLGADPYYQQGISDLMNNLDQFNIQNQAAAGDIESLFNITLQRMNKEKDRSVHDITDDFGARGLVNSGLFGKAVSDYNSDFSDRIADLNRDKSIQLRNLNFERSNMQGLNDSQAADLRLDAIRRRAEEIGSMGSVYDPVSGVKKSTGGSGTVKKVTKSPAKKQQPKPSAFGLGWQSYVGKTPAIKKPSVKPVKLKKK